MGLLKMVIIRVMMIRLVLIMMIMMSVMKMKMKVRCYLKRKWPLQFTVHRHGLWLGWRCWIWWGWGWCKLIKMMLVDQIWGVVGGFKVNEATCDSPSVQKLFFSNSILLWQNPMFKVTLIKNEDHIVGLGGEFVNLDLWKFEISSTRPNFVWMDGLEISGWGEV